MNIIILRTYIQGNIPPSLKDGSAESYSYTDSEFFIQKNILLQGLTLVTVIPSSDIHHLAAQMMRVILIIAAMVIVVGIGIAMMLSSLIIKPIRYLCSHMKSGVPEPISCVQVNDDEVGLLYTSFNDLMKTIQTLIQNVYISTEEKKKAELNTLQAQINPHFLYNALDSIGCLALMSGNDEIPLLPIWHYRG